MVGIKCRVAKTKVIRMAAEVVITETKTLAMAVWAAETTTDVLIEALPTSEVVTSIRVRMAEIADKEASGSTMNGNEAGIAREAIIIILSLVMIKEVIGITEVAIDISRDSPQLSRALPMTLIMMPHIKSIRNVQSAQRDSKVEVITQPEDSKKETQILTDRVPVDSSSRTHLVVSKLLVVTPKTKVSKDVEAAAIEAEVEVHEKPSEG